jgi:UDP-galactopyranose mutase
MKYDAIVVGAGICGLSAASYLATRGKSVLVIEKSNQIGGLCREGYHKNTRFSMFGAHIFHTDDPEIWYFLSLYTDWEFYTHKVKSFCNGRLWSIPIDYNEIGEKAEWKQLLLEDLLYTEYSKKMWGGYYDDIKEDAIGRVKSKIRYFDNRYFKDCFQGIPTHGYNTMFLEMVNTKNIVVQLNSQIDIDYVDRNTPVIYTGRIDELVKRKDLPYMTMGFTKVINGSFPWSDKYGVINFPQDYDFIRAHSSKILYNQDTKDDVIVYDYPRMAGPICYPISHFESRKLWTEIYDQVHYKYPHVIPAGRFGLFEYMDMDKAVRSGIDAAIQVLKIKENFYAKH